MGDDQKEAESVDRWLKKLKRPSDVRRIVDRCQDLRSYVTDVMLRDSDDTVTTNLVYSYTSRARARILPRDIKIAVSPRPMMRTVDALSPYPVALPIPETTAVAKSYEVLGNNLLGLSNLNRMARSAVMDALTVPLCAVKLLFEEDPSRTPLGSRMTDIRKERIARYTYLMEMDDEDEYLDEARQAQLCALSKRLKQDAADELVMSISATGLAGDMEDDPRMQRLQEIDSLGEDELVPLNLLPTVPTYQQYKFEVVNLDDFYWDWDVIDFQDHQSCKWMAHAAWLYDDEIVTMFDLDEDQAKHFTGEDSSNSYTDVDTTDHRGGTRSTNEHRWDTQNKVERDAKGRRRVYEIQDRMTGTIKVITSGVDFYLESYAPAVTHDGFFTIFPLQFNEVSGQFLGISDLELMMDLQDEYTENRSAERDARRQCHPRLVVKAGAMTDEEKQAYKNALPYDVIEIDDIESVRNSFDQLNPPTPNFQLYDRSATLADIGNVTGVPAIGAAGSATETAFASDQLNDKLQDKLHIIRTWLGDIARAVLTYALRSMTDEQITEIAGADALIPIEAREEVFAKLNLQVRVGENGTPDATEELQKMNAFVNLMMGIGAQFNQLGIAQKALDILDWDTDITQFIVGFGQPTQEQIAPVERGQPGPQPGAPGHTFQSTPSVQSLPGRAG